jgi:hypothetical protein
MRNHVSKSANLVCRPSRQILLSSQIECRKLKMQTHAELKANALKNPKVRAEYERLNREEFALLDEILAARHKPSAMNLAHSDDQRLHD